MFRKCLLMILCVSVVMVSACGAGSKVTGGSEIDDDGQTFVDGDFSYGIADISPPANQDIDVGILPVDMDTEYKYSLQVSRLSGTGTVTYNGSITGGGLGVGPVRFTGEAHFRLMFSQPGDEFEIEIDVLDGITNERLSGATFNVTVE